MPDSSSTAPRPLSDRERFLGFAFAAADMLAEADAAGRIGFATGAFRLHLGRSAEAFLGLPVAELIAPEDRGAFELARAALPVRGRMPPTVLRLADARRTPFMVSALHLALPGQPPRDCLSFAPMPEEVTLRSKAVTDPACLHRMLEERIRGRTKEAGALGLIALDETARRPGEAALNEFLDAAGAGGCVAAEIAPGRLGLLPPPGQGLEELRDILQRLATRLPEAGEARTIPLDTPGLTPVQAVRALRHCLSVFARDGAKGLSEAGFDGGLDGFVSAVGQRSLMLARAIEHGQFYLLYQPIQALVDRRTHHFEALCRPLKGVLGESGSPAEFVTLAEAVGLTEKLDIAVFDAASAEVETKAPSQRVAVNLSGLSVQSPAFRERLFSRLDRKPSLAPRLMVELTESAEIEQEEEAAATLEGLRARGVPVCLDDFGAGAAAFRYLRAYRVDYVKVDGAFVTAALEHERDRRFVASMVDLSRAVGAEVIAERIETAAHAALMHELGVAYGQGWHLGRPGPLPRREATAVAPGKRRGMRESWG
ncbi:MAG: EAL domain-containing protein [Roseococcus sp.]|nr:EAL domain-containing protein [Roseococcus sp.]